MERIPEKTIKRYVLATMHDGQCWYLHSIHKIGAWEMVADIEAATKTTTKSIAKVLLNDYKRDFGDKGYDFIIIPLIIDYSLIKEIDD